MAGDGVGGVQEEVDGMHPKEMLCAQGKEEKGHMIEDGLGGRTVAGATAGADERNGGRREPGALKTRQRTQTRRSSACCTTMVGGERRRWGYVR